jgi:iron complex transport system substrate-binding protein
MVCVLGACSNSSVAPAAKSGIVTIAPNLTETVFALGAGDQVIGVGNFCDYPPEIADLPRVGGYIDPNLERLTLLNPAMIIVPGKHPEVAKFGAARGMQVLHVHMDDLATIESGIRTIGAAVQRVAAAEALIARLAAALDAVQGAVAERPRPKVFVLVTRNEHNFNNLFTVGGPSFMSEMVAIAGGENIFAEEKSAYFEASKESLVMRAPEVILEFHAGDALSAAKQAAYKADWAAFPSVPAVRTGRVHIITEPYSLRPGPRVDLIARQLAGLLHPDVELPGP